MNLFLDIETCPDLSEGALQRCINAVEAPGQYKKAESIAEWKMANAIPVGTEAWQRTALNPMAGGIYVVGFAIGDAAPRALHREPGEPEAPFLEAALGAISADIGLRSPRFIGWNVMGFDLPFIAKRCAIHGINPALRLPMGTRYNNERVLDLMVAWSGFKDFNKQRDVAAAMHIPLLDETDGKDLWTQVESLGVAAAAKKCESDLLALREIYSRMAPVFGF